jgi:hypothetical protein
MPVSAAVAADARLGGPVGSARPLHGAPPGRSGPDDNLPLDRTKTVLYPFLRNCK